MLRAQRDDYPLAFWCLVFFTFIVFVAPQNIYATLQPLHLAKASAILALAAYAGRKLSRREPILPVGPEFRLLTALTVLAVLSIPFSLWPGGSFGVLTDLYLKSVLVFILTAQVITSVLRLRQMLWWLLLFCFGISIIAMAGYQQGNLAEGYRMQGAWGGISSNPNDFALTINLIIPFAVALFMLNQGFVKKTIIAAFLIVAVSAILATYSRGGFITLGTVVSLILFRNIAGRKALISALPILLMVIVFVVLTPEGYGTRLESIADPSKDKFGSATARWTSMVRTFDVIAEHPLLGVGMGMNILALNEKGLFWTQAHNVYLELASEIGLPGLLVFVLLVWRLLKGLRHVQTERQGDVRNLELSSLAGACEISLLAFCVAALFHPVAYQFYFYYIAGFAMALKGISERMERVADPNTSEILQRSGQVMRHSVKTCGVGVH